MEPKKFLASRVIGFVSTQLIKDLKQQSCMVENERIHFKMFLDLKLQMVFSDKYLENDFKIGELVSKTLHDIYFHFNLIRS